MDGKITYHQQVSYCGKPRCRRCREGIGHGPYWYAYQTVNGRTVRTYVGKNPPAEILAQSAETGGLATSEFANTLLRFSVLGQFRLEQRGTQNGSGPTWESVTEASLQHQRVRALLSCLASSPGRKLAREQAIEVLWPDLDFETASHRLDRAVHSLRQVFEPGRSRPATSKLLLTEHSTLALAEQSLFWIDADAFENLITQARATDDPGQTEQLLEEAAQLYSGDFLPEETQIEAVQSRRESLRRSWISLLLELADLRIAREATPGAIEILDRLLAADATNEAAVQRLVVQLAQTGRRGEAIQSYQRFATILKQDYKIAPLPETRALYEAVLRGSTSIETPRKRTTQPSVPGELSPALSLSSGSLVAIPAHMHIGRTHQSPLVGRDEEIGRLNQILEITEQTRRLRLTGQKKSSLLAPLNLEAQRNAQCVMLMGDVGIGKTRLAEEAAREAKRRNWAVAWCRAYVQESNVPYRLWTETLRKAMTQGLWQRQEVTRRPLIYQPLRSLLPELQDLLPQALQVMPPPPEQEQLRLWESTRALLSTICENTTLLIVLDDLQWADTSSCELLTYLVRQMRGMPVMFLCTCRDTEIPVGHHLRPVLTDLQREQAIALVPVAPLSKEQIQVLISHLPATMAETISTRASGNPFFAEELARGVVAGDLAAAFDPAKPKDLPETISAVLDLRLARISQQCQRLLERGAVLGDSFQFDTICAMASGGVPADEDMILDLLEEAMQAGMLDEEGNGMNISYNFWHPLLLTYLYEHISAARRASLHRRAGQVMQEHYAGREAEGAAEIVHHLINGGSAPALVARYAELAADRAYSLSAYPSAEKHYRLALQNLGPLAPNAPQEERLHHAYIIEYLGECTMVQGKFEEARTFYEQVLEVRGKNLVFASDEKLMYEAQLEALIWCEIGQAWRYAGDNKQAKMCISQAEDLLFNAHIDNGPAWARIRYQQSQISWRERDLESALTLAYEALKLCESSLSLQRTMEESAVLTRAQRTLKGDRVDLGRMHTLIAGITGTSGDALTTLGHLNTALNIFEKHDSKREIANVCCNLADLYLRRSEYSSARSVLTRSHDIAEQIGDIPITSIVVGNLGVLSARLGNLIDAENWYRQALSFAEQVNDLFYVSLLNSYLAMVLIEQGKLDEAKAALVQALKISRTKQITPCIGLALVTIGHLRFARTYVDEKQIATLKFHKSRLRNKYEYLLNRAKTTLQHALTFESLETETKIDGYLVLAEVTLLSGNLEAAFQQATQTLKEAQECELTWLQAGSQRLLARILAAQGQHSEAILYFQQALSIFKSTDMQLEYGRTLQAYGTILLQDPSVITRQQSLQYINEARQIFQDCHAMLDWQAAEHLLTQQTTPATTTVTIRKTVRKVR
jgi:DNA-binding SARP family transcriptional activator